MLPYNNCTEGTHIGDVDEGRSLLRGGFGRGGGPLHLGGLLLQQHSKGGGETKSKTITYIQTLGNCIDFTAFALTVQGVFILKVLFFE